MLSPNSNDEPIQTNDISRPDPSLIEALQGIGSATAVGELKRLGIRSAFIQGPIPLRLNRREVHEDVLSVLALDKAIALGCVKPLHCTFFFHLPMFLLLLKNAFDLRPGPEIEKGGADRLTHPLVLYEAEN